MSDLVGMSPGSFRVVLFVKFIIDLTTSNEKYGQGHLPIFDPGLLYQASHKNTIELCKINIFYLHLFHRCEFWSYLTSHFGVTCPSAVKKKEDVSSFSQSPLIGSLSNLQVMRTGIKARTSSNLGQIGLFTLELFALEHRFLIPGAIYMY